MGNKLREAQEKYASGNFDEAIREIMPLALSGVPEAESLLGVMYLLGEGVGRDIEKAVQWLELAMQHGQGEAAHNLGTLYLSCEPELPVDHEKARQLYLKAKSMGCVVADSSFYDNL